MTDPPRTTIAVLTYLRSADLSELLPLLVQQAESVDPRRDPDPMVDVLVIDNDPAGGAAGTVADASSPRVRYAHEAVPGIAAARNRALKETSDSEILVFIDDDERPLDDWLCELLETYRATGAAAVSGPVVSEFVGTLDPWIVAGGFFDRKHRRRARTGDRIESAATNNLLLDLTQINSIGLRFDTRFGLSGGEDTFFTRQLVKHGGLMVWCSTAAVSDRVPAARMTRRYALKRSWSHANTGAVIDLLFATTWPRKLTTRARICGRGVQRLIGGGGRFGLGLLTRSQRHQARGMRTLTRGAGMISGALGHVYLEYARTSDS